MKPMRLFIPVLLLFVLFNFQTQAQEKKGKDQVFKVVDTMPVYPGGEEALRKDIASKVKYPESAKKKGISGKVYVTFVVDKDGKIVDLEIARGVESTLDEEALRVMSLLKTWKPGSQRGIPVKVQYTIPIQFALNGDSKSKNQKIENKRINEAGNEVFFVVEDMPEFPGGEEALRLFISKNVKYPDEAIKEKVQGKVYITFTVTQEGKVADARIARGVCPSLDKEALRVINTLPKWKPGKQRGQAVNVEYTVPINFALK
jgi:TonB family protein